MKMTTNYIWNQHLFFLFITNNYNINKKIQNNIIYIVVFNSRNNILMLKDAMNILIIISN